MTEPPFCPFRKRWVTTGFGYVTYGGWGSYIRGLGLGLADPTPVFKRAAWRLPGGGEGRGQLSPPSRPGNFAGGASAPDRARALVSVRDAAHPRRRARASPRRRDRADAEPAAAERAIASSAAGGSSPAASDLRGGGRAGCVRLANGINEGLIVHARRRAASRRRAERSTLPRGRFGSRDAFGCV